MPMRPDQVNFVAPRFLGGTSNLQWPNPESTSPPVYFYNGNLNGADPAWPGETVFLNYVPPSHVDDDYFGGWFVRQVGGAEGSDNLSVYADQSTSFDVTGIDSSGTQCYLQVRGSWHRWGGASPTWRSFLIGSDNYTITCAPTTDNFTINVPITKAQALEFSGIDGYCTWYTYILNAAFSPPTVNGYYGLAIWKMGVIAPFVVTPTVHAPGFPTGVTAAAGANSGEAALSWTPPVDDGGATITGYETTTWPGGEIHAYGATTAVVLTGLDLGVEYTFEVRASNTAGNGLPGYSNAITLTTPPGPDDPITPQIAVSIYDPVKLRSPSTVNVAVAGGQPNTDAVLSIDGVEVTTVLLDTDGSLGVRTLPFTDLAAGSHDVLVTQTVESGDIIYGLASFTIAEDPAAFPLPPDVGLDPVDVPAAVVPGTGVRRWVLQDLAPGGLGNYILPINPKSMTSPHYQKTLQARRSTAVGGQYHVTEAASQPKAWQFAGYAPTQEMCDQLQAYGALKYRFWLVDHRNRAWQVVFVNVQLEPRLRHRYNDVLTDWGTDYTVQALILSQNWAVPS
jgi:hypothetical protein